MASDRDDIERVRQATNIVELIEAVTTVKKQGRAVMAVCPFHQEKTPSMSIEPAQGLYHCFGCGASGDIFKFIQETHGLRFPEALELLATRAGITLTRDPQAAKRRGERDALTEAVQAALEFFHDRLKNGEDAGGVRSYVRGRGYDADVVNQFKMGYAPEAWDDLVKYLRARGIKDTIMIDAGLARRGSGGRLYDYFRGRLMFPIWDLRGDPVGFGGRILEGDGAKYINTPETRLYKKAQLLYGLHEAKSEIARAGYAVVVEGYTDVIALHLAGYPLAVATCGTALGEDHFDLLRRFADRVVLAFDADQAGAGAAIRGDELQTPGDLELDLRVAVMPEGRDPAELVSEGNVDQLKKAVDDSLPVVQFRISRELERHDLSEPEGRARAVRAVVPLIAKSPDEIARREYARLVARRTGMEMEPILRAVEERLTGGRRPGSRSDDGRTQPRLSGIDLAERDLLRLLILHDDEDLAGVTEDLFSHPGRREAAAWLLGALAGVPLGTPVALAELPPGDMADQLRKLALVNDPLPPADDVMRRLRRRGFADRIAQLRRAVDELDPKSEEYSSAFDELIALQRERRRDTESTDAESTDAGS
jgi:DNA primase